MKKEAWSRQYITSAEKVVPKQKQGQTNHISILLLG